MTVLTAAGASNPATGLGEGRVSRLPLRRMAWVTWRQHRTALIGLAALVVALIVLVWILGLRLHHAYAAAVSCHPPGSAACGNLDRRLQWDRRLPIERPGPPGPSPAHRRVRRCTVVGPRVRERHGPLRLVTRIRAGPLDARQAGCARGRGDRSDRSSRVLLSWYYQPYFAAGDQSLTKVTTVTLNSLSPTLFDLRGVASGPGPSPHLRSVVSPACSFGGSSPPFSPPWRSMADSPSQSGAGCACTTWRRWSPLT